MEGVEPIMELSLGHPLKRYGTQLLLGLQTISTQLRCGHYKWYQSYAQLEVWVSNVMTCMPIRGVSYQKKKIEKAILMSDFPFNL